MRRGLVALAGLLVLTLLLACQPTEKKFSGQRALQHVAAQCAFGPRPVGSEANRKTADYIARTLQRYGWQVERQDFVHKGYQVGNVIGKKGTGPLVILGTHFDTRPVADHDPTDRSQPVMGANDGGSGTAVLLELARVLDASATRKAQIWLVFFDAEDRGELNDWEWSVGARHFVATLTAEAQTRPEYVVIVDMVGDKDQRIFYEWTSSLWLQERIWQLAKTLGYGEQFIPQHGYTVIDDHTPFLNLGFTAALLIDLDYPYWHTRYDTLDKISADSLQRVGDVLEALLEGEPFAPSP